MDAGAYTANTLIYSLISESTFAAAVDATELLRGRTVAEKIALFALSNFGTFGTRADDMMRF